VLAAQLLAGAMVPCHAQVLAKGSALHKSCLRGKLLLFDPTSSLQPCRTVKIHRQAALRPSSWPERPLVAMIWGRVSGFKKHAPPRKSFPTCHICHPEKTVSVSGKRIVLDAHPKMVPLRPCHRLAVQCPFPGRKSVAELPLDFDLGYLGM